MKKLLKRPDYFLILSLTLTYLLGLILAKGLGKTISLLSLLSGLLFMTGYYLVVTFAWPENQFSAFDRRATGTSGIRTEPRILILLAAIALTLISLFFLIRAHFFEYLLIPSLLVFLVSALMALNYSFRAQSMPFRWLLDALAVSPIAYFFGLLITGLKVSFFPFMLGIPLFLIACGSTIALFFARFQEDLTQQQYQSMQTVNWNRLAQLHDLTAFMGYALLTAYLYSSGALTIAWPVSLMVLAAFGCSLLLHRITNGMHPNWKLLKALAIVNFIGVIYILGFAFLTH